jgi:ATP-dependent Clp protease ATP-binding subunit ClpA
MQDPLALQILSGEFKEGDTVAVEADHEGLYFEKEKVAA